MNLGRRAALLAGLPETVPGLTVNRFCASSLQSIRMAFHAIRAGEGDTFVAAGVESTSQVSGYPKSEEELHPALFGDDAPIANVYIPMGLTAENVAERWDVSRDDMDRFAQQSQERAVAAQQSGFFARETGDFVLEEDKDNPAYRWMSLETKRICSGCEVRAQCLEYALAHDERFGIWGGLSERERRRLKRRAG